MSCPTLSPRLIRKFYLDNGKRLRVWSRTDWVPEECFWHKFKFVVPIHENGRTYNVPLFVEMDGTGFVRVTFSRSKADLHREKLLSAYPGSDVYSFQGIFDIMNRACDDWSNRHEILSDLQDSEW